MIRHRHAQVATYCRVRCRKALGAALAVTSLVLATGSLASACENDLTGRVLEIGPGADFGKVQGLPPLPLDAQEYVVTIDDGPNPRTTPELLDVLDKACVKATFFLIGKHARAHPDLVREIVARGHSVGSHSFSHPNLRGLSEEEIAKQIDLGVEWVEQSAFGDTLPKGTPALLRFPGSSGPTPVTSSALIDMAHERGLIVAGYDISPEDWRNSPPKESYRRLVSRLKDRGVIVFHDGKPNTIALLPMALDELKRRGDRVVSLTLSSEEAR